MSRINALFSNNSDIVSNNSVLATLGDTNVESQGGKVNLNSASWWNVRGRPAGIILRLA